MRGVSFGHRHVDDYVVLAGFLSSLPEILDLVQGGKLRYLVWYSK